MGRFYIYEIKNTVNGKTYVGQHHFIEGQKDEYMGSGTILKVAQKKYGLSNFKKTILEYVDSKNEADEREKFYIALYKNQGKAEYNLTEGGGGTVGYHLTEEQRHKQRVGLGKYYNPYYEIRIKKVKSKIWKSAQGIKDENIKNDIFRKLFHSEDKDRRSGYLYAIEEMIRNQIFQESLEEMENIQQDYEKNGLSLQ